MADTGKTPLVSEGTEPQQPQKEKKSNTAIIIIAIVILVLIIIGLAFLIKHLSKDDEPTDNTNTTVNPPKTNNTDNTNTTVNPPKTNNTDTTVLVLPVSPNPKSFGVKSFFWGGTERTSNSNSNITAVMTRSTPDIIQVKMELYGSVTLNLVQNMESGPVFKGTSTAVDGNQYTLWFKIMKSTVLFTNRPDLKDFETFNPTGTDTGNYTWIEFIPAAF